jgi:ribonuclease P protein component
MPSEAFPRRARLTTPADYARAKKGLRRSSSHLSLWAARTGDTRLGLTISRKVAKSHDRQLWKRRVRDIFRRRRATFLPGYDHVIVARNGAAALSFDELVQEIGELLSKVKPR